MSITDRPESPTISSQLEKGELEVDHDHHADDDLPEKMQGHYMRNLRHQIFTLYRKLFVVIFVANLVAFAALFTSQMRYFNSEALHCIQMSQMLQMPRSH